MKFFVTGGAGFIGSNFIDMLLSNGHEVTAYDNLSTGQIKFLANASKSKNFNFVKGDLLDEDNLTKSMINVDFVVHFAANADIRHGLESPKRDIEQNIIATFNLLESMRKLKIKKIIFASSAAVLGEPQIFPTPEDIPIPKQTSLYGASKMACENLLSAYCEGFNFEAYVYRFVSVLGKRYPHGHVFDFVRKIKEDASILEVLGDGTQRKSYMHIDDCIEAINLTAIVKKTAEKLKTKIEIYNLGNPDYISVEDSAKLIISKMGFDTKIKYTGGKQGWVGDNPFVFLDIKKIQKHGWKPNKTIIESLVDTVNWLKDNDWIFEKRR